MSNMFFKVTNETFYLNVFFHVLMFTVYSRTPEAEI